MEVVDAFVAVVVVVVVELSVLIVIVVEDACNISSTVYATKNIEYISISCNTVYTHVITIVVTIFICIWNIYV